MDGSPPSKAETHSLFANGGGKAADAAVAEKGMSEVNEKFHEGGEEIYLPTTK